jgi:hypothetical protein
VRELESHEAQTHKVLGGLLGTRDSLEVGARSLIAERDAALARVRELEQLTKSDIDRAASARHVEIERERDRARDFAKRWREFANRVVNLRGATDWSGWTRAWSDERDALAAEEDAAK